MSIHALAHKRGFGLTGGFWNRFGAILIEAPIHIVTDTLTKHFHAQCSIEALPASLEEQNKHFLWQYVGHTWTTWWAFSSEEVAFALALFLETKVMVLTHQGTSDWTTFKVFDQDKWVEHYEFGHHGFDDPDQKVGDLGWGIGFWDLEVTYEYLASPNSAFPIQTRHLFSSAIRKLTEKNIHSALHTGANETGFLNTTLQCFGAYLPDCIETPLTYSRSATDFQPTQSDFARIDSVILPTETFYWQNMLPVPQRVTL